MAINFNINCDDVDMPLEKLKACNFTSRLMRLPIGVILLVVSLVFILGSTDWVPRIIGALLLLGGVGFFAVLIFNGPLSKREHESNQQEIESHRKMSGSSREDAVRAINASRLAMRQPTYSTSVRRQQQQPNVINVNL